MNVKVNFSEINDKFPAKFDSVTVVTGTGYEDGYNNALAKLKKLSVTQNGTYAPLSGEVGYNEVEVNVDTTGAYNEGYSEGYAKGEQDGEKSGYNDAVSKLTDLTATANGEYTPPSGKIGFNKVSVSVNQSTSEDLDDVLTEQEELIEELKSLLKEKASGEDTNSKWKSFIEGTLTEITPSDLNGVTVIDKNTFYGNQSLKYVELPDGIEDIRKNAFRNCGNLEKLIIGEGIQIITSTSVSENPALKMVEIPKSVWMIQSYGISQNEALTTLVINALSPPMLIRLDDFYYSPLEKIIVPAGCADAYKNATNWSSFADIIVEEEM